MARLPYADLSTPALQPLVERVIAERGSVLHLYHMLLHSAPLAQGWLNFLTAVRHQCGLAGDLRELVIMRVAMLNHARYEAEQHAPIALKEGMTRAQIDDLGRWERSAEFSDMQRAVLALTDAMTRDVQVPAAVLDAVRVHLDDTRVVELVGTVGAYNMVSRFLVALDIHSEDERAT